MGDENGMGKSACASILDRGREMKLENDDIGFYIITLILFLGIMASIFAGLPLIGNILGIVLTVYLVAVAQIEWKNRGGKWR